MLVAQSCLTLCDSMGHQAPLSVGFSRQEYWSGLPFPTPRDLPNPGIKLMSLASLALAAESLLLMPPGKTDSIYSLIIHCFGLTFSFNKFCLLSCSVVFEFLQPHGL